MGLPNTSKLTKTVKATRETERLHAQHGAGVSPCSFGETPKVSVGFRKLGYNSVVESSPDV